MDIVIIGTGNTATILGKKLREAGHNILQVFGRDAHAASELAYTLDTDSTNYWSLVKEAHIYILAVSDIAIEEVVKELNLKNKIVVHTAASVSKDVLKSKTSHFGVLYPLQSLKKEVLHLPDTPIIIDASDEATMQELNNLAHTISDHVVEGDDEMRLKLHLAAVFVNNFVNHLFVLIEKYCKEENIDFNLLKPLIKETIFRLEEVSPSDAQTGPAIRNDKNTITKHLELLSKYPHLQELYKLFSSSIYSSNSVK